MVATADGDMIIEQQQIREIRCGVVDSGGGVKVLNEAKDFNNVFPIFFLKVEFCFHCQPRLQKHHFDIVLKVHLLIAWVSEEMSNKAM